MNYSLAFEKWFNKNYPDEEDEVMLKISCWHTWNAAHTKILKRIKLRHKQFNGSWQHEDIEALMEDIVESGG